MILICYYTNLGALNTMVPSELTRRVCMGELLVLLVCWKSGPYGVPDQQGDTEMKYRYRRKFRLVFTDTGQGGVKNRYTTQVFSVPFFSFTSNEVEGNPGIFCKTCN
jgi:hypothetical protein